MNIYNGHTLRFRCNEDYYFRSGEEPPSKKICLETLYAKEAATRLKAKEKAEWDWIAWQSPNAVVAREVKPHFNQPWADKNYEYVLREVLIQTTKLAANPNLYQIKGTQLITKSYPDCEEDYYFICGRYCRIKYELQIGEMCNDCNNKHCFAAARSKKPELVQLYPVFEWDDSTNSVKASDYIPLEYPDSEIVKEEEWSKEKWESFCKPICKANSLMFKFLMKYWKKGNIITSNSV